MIRSVKIAMAVAGMAVGLAGCGGGTLVSSGPGAPTPDHPTAGSSCEDSLERVEGLGALGANCDTAHGVAEAYDSKIMGAGNFPGNASLDVGDGWFCGSRVSGESEEIFSVTCDKGDSEIEAVTFAWGV